MNAQEISKMIEAEISGLRKSGQLKEKLRIGEHQLDENYMIRNLVSPHLEYYNHALGSKLWTVWEEEHTDSIKERYVIIYDEEYKAFA